MGVVVIVVWIHLLDLEQEFPRLFWEGQVQGQRPQQGHKAIFISTSTRGGSRNLGGHDRASQLIKKKSWTNVFVDPLGQCWQCGCGSCGRKGIESPLNIGKKNPERIGRNHRRPATKLQRRS